MCFLFFFFEETKCFTTDQLKIVVNLLQTHTKEKLTEVLENEILARSSSGGDIISGDNNSTLGIIIELFFHGKGEK